MTGSGATSLAVWKQMRPFGYCLILLALGTVHAAETEVDALQQEIQALRKQVRDLRMRVEALEEKKDNAQRPLTTASERSTPSYKVADTGIPLADDVAGLKQRWSAIARGMTGSK